MVTDLILIYIDKVLPLLYTKSNQPLSNIFETAHAMIINLKG